MNEKIYKHGVLRKHEEVEYHLHCFSCRRSFNCYDMYFFTVNDEPVDPSLTCPWCSREQTLVDFSAPGPASAGEIRFLELRIDVYNFMCLTCGHGWEMAGSDISKIKGKDLFCPVCGMHGPVEGWDK